MPRKSIVVRKEQPGSEPRTKQPAPKSHEPGTRVLFVEDGDTEFSRFRSSLKGSFDLLLVESGREASRHLKDDTGIDIVLVTMRFPTTLEEELTGLEDTVIQRFSGNREKALDFVRENQGIFVTHHLRKQIAEQVPILILHDFSDDLPRWDTLTSRYSGVYYVRKGMGPIDVADLMRTIIEKGRSEHS